MQHFITSNSVSFNFLKSALSVEGDFLTTNDVMEWLSAQNKKIKVQIDKIRFRQMNQWGFKGGRFVHDSGKFFSIEGLHIETDWGDIPQWHQPIINQPEIGYLGIIAKEFNGVLHFLMQAKIEPGNVNYVQLSPTLQATKSNYLRVHKGKAPHYLNFFTQASPEQIILDQLQSEQGARFLKKRNRNIIIKIDDDVPVYDNFTWLTLAQIKSLMLKDNLVNMDTRTVISGIGFGGFNSEVVDYFDFFRSVQGKSNIAQLMLKSSISNSGAVHDYDYITSFLARMKSEYELELQSVPLNQLACWRIDNSKIYHEEHKYFQVIAVHVSIENREVVNWSQPMIEPMQEGICAFVCREINGLLHFAVQAKLECGNHDIIEFAPTVQCMTGNYRSSNPRALPFLDYVLNASAEKIIYDTMQSEEGGRFYQEQNRNMIVLAGDELSEELPSNFLWMSLNQINMFIKFNNYFNIQARSLVAAISFT